MMMRQVVAGAALGSLLFVAGCGSGYDDDIDQVIEMENEHLGQGTNENNVTSIEREETGIEVYDEGEYIRLTYNIRPNDTISKSYKREGESYSQTAIYDVRQYLESAEPEYTENFDE